MKKYIWPLLVIFFLSGGLVAILIGQVVLPPEPRAKSVQEISEKWSVSGHSDSESLSFSLWDNREPPVIPESCAKCHSTYGYLDYLGEDGSEVNTVNEVASIGSVVSCLVCHNPSAHEKNSVIFPSGAVINGQDNSSNCMECHQGRRSSQDVENSVMNLPDDMVNEDLGFINVHYRVGGAVRFGSEVAVSYEYPNQNYIGFYPHVDDYQQCTDCHDPHSLAITPTECAACHPVVSGFENLRDIRMEGTPDFDGDGDISEGLYGELMGVHRLLYETIQVYAAEVIGEPIVYQDQNPYWFSDTDGNTDNPYASWTPRLVRATYNYHLVVEDPGGFMHNARYLIQVMYDTIDDFSTVVSIDMPNLIRPE
jgi:hypothetical protein